MTGNKNSAEIYELSDARARLRPEVDPLNFVDIGKYLEAVRSHLGLSIERVSDQTHIKAQYLAAIEAMAVDRLPAKPFAIGFVRVYAEALGLEPGDIVERFKQEAGFGEKHAEAEVEDDSRSREQAAAERPELSLLAVLAILAFMVWCAFVITRPGETVRPLRLDGLPSAAEPDAATIMSPERAAMIAAEEARAGLVPSDIVEARILERVDPIYPLRCEAVAAPVETVTVVFTITAAGGVASERVSASSNACFDRDALNALRQWRFEPRKVDGAARPAFDQATTFRFDRPA